MDHYSGYLDCYSSYWQNNSNFSLQLRILQAAVIIRLHVFTLAVHIVGPNPKCALHPNDWLLNGFSK